MSALRQRKGEVTSPKAAAAAAPAAAAAAPGLITTQLIESSAAHIHGSFLEKHEAVIPWLLLAVAAATRFWRLDKPNGVVFDETHFGRFTNQYLAGTYLFDIHPPLGKLVFWAVCKLVGYDWEKCGYANISDEFGADCKYMAIRVTAAAFGTLTAPLFYFIVRNWGGSILAAILASYAFIVDGLNTTEDRLILTDSQLMFWIAAALLSAQMWWRRYNDHTLAVEAYRRDNKNKWPTAAFMRERKEYAGRPFHVGRARQLWCVWMGFVTANAISIKWTALATPGLIALESFFAMFFLRRSVDFLDLLKVAGVAFATYANWFYWHFWLLPKAGDGDAFMKIEFQRTLVGNANYDPIHPHPGFWASFYYLNGEMLSANARIAVRHAWESLWYEWPLNLRGLLYYSKNIDDPDKTNTVYLLGNPLVIWPVGAMMVLTFVLVVFYMRYQREPGLDIGSHFKKYVAVVAFGTVAYSLNLLPYVGVKRSCFAYHYMPALMYAELVTPITMDRVFGPKYMGLATKLLLVLYTAGFLYFAPWIYALPLSADEHAARRWLRRWD